MKNRRSPVILLLLFLCGCRVVDPDIPIDETTFQRKELPSYTVEEIEKTGTYVRLKITVHHKSSTILDDLRVCYDASNALPDTTCFMANLSSRLLLSNEIEVTIAGLVPATTYNYSIYMANEYRQLYSAVSRFVTKEASWVKVGGLPSSVNSYVSFKIKDKVYVLSRYNGVNHAKAGQLWEYDPESVSWSYKGQSPFEYRRYLKYFAIEDKLYMGLGYEDAKNASGSYSLSYYDWWCYDSEQNEWTQKKDVVSRGFHDMAFFSVGDKGYILSSFNDVSQDFPNVRKDAVHLFEYDPKRDTWSEKASFPGTKVQRSSSFVIGEKAYVFTGYRTISYYNEEGTYRENIGWDLLDDMWVYDQRKNQWSRCGSFPGGGRDEMFTVSLDGKGYAGAGRTKNQDKSEWVEDWWCYSPDVDEWYPLPALPYHYFEFSFEVNGEMYVGDNTYGLWKYVEK